MAVSKYLNSYDNAGEQNLIEDLIIEQIQHKGVDLVYLPRTGVNQDGVYAEATLVEFNTAVTIESLLDSFEAFQGDGSFMSNLGVEVRDQVVFSFSQRRFSEETSGLGLRRPNEGDLVWYPLNKKLFEVKYVDKFEMHYPLGKLYTWKLRCELFDYAGQTFNTGKEEIDIIQGQLSQNYEDFYQHDTHGNLVLDTDGKPVLIDSSNPMPVDPLDDSLEIQREADEIIDFTEYDPFSEGKW